MVGVKYIGPFYDHSGYGEASRNYILALHQAGIPLTIEARSFERNPPPVGTAGDRAVLAALERNAVPFDIVIVHLTPDLVPAIAREYPGKYIINYTVWETSTLHPLWVDACNQAHEVWVPCTWNAEAFVSSGVRVPVVTIPHGIDTSMFFGISANDSPLSSKSGEFLFYSIFQWNARKNPEGLLRAYYSTFAQAEDVRLVLKTYTGRGLSAQAETEVIKQHITAIKQDMLLTSYPRVSLITESLSTEQVRATHLRGDAYISLTCGEGWGLGAFEAGLAGKPVIMTGAGGNMDFMTEENSYPVPFMWDYVADMSSFNRWYQGNQQWARPDLVAASKLMRHVYENREEARTRGKLLQERITTTFGWGVVAAKMITRLEEISGAV